MHPGEATRSPKHQPPCPASPAPAQAATAAPPPSPSPAARVEEAPATPSPAASASTPALPLPQTPTATPPPAAIRAAAAAAAASPAAPATPLEQRTWRRTAQSSVRTALTAVKDARSRFQAAFDQGLTAATQLVNLLLRAAFLPGRPRGVLAGRRDLLAAAMDKLLRQQQEAYREVADAVWQAAAAVEAMWAAVHQLEQQQAPWQASLPVFHATPLPHISALLSEVALLHSKELAVQQHLLLGFAAELVLAWQAAAAAAGAPPPLASPPAAATAPMPLPPPSPAAATGQLVGGPGVTPIPPWPPNPPVWLGQVLDPVLLTREQAVQQLQQLGLLQVARSSGPAEDAGATHAARNDGGRAADSDAARAGGAVRGSDAAMSPLQPADLAFRPAVTTTSSSSRDKNSSSSDAADVLRGVLSVPLTAWKATACLDAGRAADVLQLLTDDMAGL